MLPLQKRNIKTMTLRDKIKTSKAAAEVVRLQTLLQSHLVTDATMKKEAQDLTRQVRGASSPALAITPPSGERRN